MSTEITAETITDEQIQKLRTFALARRNHELAATCHDALPGSTRWEQIADWGETRPVPEAVRREARARCAEVLRKIWGGDFRTCQVCGVVLHDGPTSRDRERFERRICGGQECS